MSGTNQEIEGSGAVTVQSVTGTQVDNTDPFNPIVNPLGLIKIVDLNGEFFTDLATASAYISTVTSATITNESYSDGVYYFTVPQNTSFDLGPLFFLGFSPTNASIIDEIGLITSLVVSFGFYKNNGNHKLGNVTFVGDEFNSFSGTIEVKSIVDLTLPSDSFAENSTGKFIIKGNIGATPSGNSYSPFFLSSTATILVNKEQYTINSGGIQGDLQTAIANGCNVQFDGINLVKQNFDKDKNNFRLTLTSGLSVTTSDVVNASTIYCTPHNGNVISLYNGTNWILYESNEFSLVLGTLTNNIPYDIFCYANSGVPTLEFLAWTNTTTRATSLVSQDGILVKTGATTRRYLGTFLASGNQTATVTITNASPAVITYTTHGLTANAPIVFTTSGALPTGIIAGQTYYLASIGTATANTFNISATPGGALINTSSAGSGTHTATISTYTEDSLSNRFLSNGYNQAVKKLFVKENATSWDYTTNTARQVNANILNQLNFIQGLDNLVLASYKTRCSNSSANVGIITSVALDSITTASISSAFTIAVANIGSNSGIICDFNNYTGIGKHYIAALEQSSATGTTRWYSGGAAISTSITGQILC